MNPINSLLLLVYLLFSGHSAPDPANGYELIRLMHERYADNWYEYLTFEQKTTFYGSNGNVERTQIWHEALALPGHLAIKFDEKESGNGILFSSGMQYGFANGQLIQHIERTHDLLVLGFDVYKQEPDSTIKQLEALGFDLSKIYSDVWEGRPVYVVGVSEPDEKEQQFWIDKERLVFVRNLQIGRQNTIQEVQFNKYETLGGGWIAPEVVFKVDGITGLLEEYSRIQLPDTIDEKLFKPESFIETIW